MFAAYGTRGDVSEDVPLRKQPTGEGVLKRELLSLLRTYERQYGQTVVAIGMFRQYDSGELVSVNVTLTPLVRGAGSVGTPPG